MKPRPDDLFVACLCAAWCHVCSDYRSTFEALAREPGAGARWRWIDIEDDEDLLGGVEVDDFPTLLVADREGVRFFGVIAPSEKATRLVLSRAARPDVNAIDDARLQALASRLFMSVSLG